MKTAGAALAGLLLGVLLGEVGARMFLPRPGFVPNPGREAADVKKADERRGYVYLPNVVREVETPDYRIEFRTNSLGLRDVEPAEVDPSAIRVLAVGDSYTQGLGVQAMEAWPKRLEARLPGLHVFNAGVSGYGLHQMRAMAEELLEPLQIRAIVVGVYGNGHRRVTDPFVMVDGSARVVERSIAQNVRISGDGLLLAAFNTPALRAAGYWIDEHWYFAGHLMHLIFGPLPPKEARAVWHSPGRAVLEREMRPMLDELEVLHQFTRRREVPLIALLINPAEPEGSFSPVQLEMNEVIAAFAQSIGVCLVDPVSRFESDARDRSLRLGSNAHWSALAHDLAAEAIVESLRGSLDPASARDAPCKLAAERLVP